MSPELTDPRLDHRVVKATARYVRALWAFRIVGILLALGILIYLVQTVAAIRETQKSNTARAVTDTRILELIESCTTPEGECTQRGARNQAKALDLIKGDTLEVVVAVIACEQDGITEAKPLARCAAERLDP